MSIKFVIDSATNKHPAFERSFFCEVREYELTIKEGHILKILDNVMNLELRELRNLPENQ